MKKYVKALLTVCMVIFAAPVIASDSTLNGAFQLKKDNKTYLLLLQDGYLAATLFDETSKEFDYTWGGPFRFKDSVLIIKKDFDTKADSTIGDTVKWNILLKKDTLFIKDKGLVQKWTIAPGNKQALDGVWRISGRMQGGVVNSIPRADRKTLKLLAGGYFQWIAINPAVKGFYGTGGGTYTFENNVYAERISFFSRDKERVGAVLSFRGELKDGAWHHSGKSSSGDAIYEVWNRDKNP